MKGTTERDAGNLFVSDGISDGRTYATYRRKPSGSLQRVRSPGLPERATRAEAELDLYGWLYDRVMAGNLDVETRRSYDALRASLLARLNAEGGASGDPDRRFRAK